MDLPTHLLRPWTVRVRPFQEKVAADLWAAKDAGGCDAAATPAPPPYLFEEGSLLKTVSPAGDALYHPADAAGATSFFIAVGVTTGAAGVSVQGVALKSDTGLEENPVVSKRRRLGAPEDANAVGTVSRQATAAAAAVGGVSDDGTPPIFAGGIGGAVKRFQRGQSRPVGSWSYTSPGSSAEGGEELYRSPLIGVATALNDFVSPSGLTGDVQQMCELLLRGASVFLTGPPGSGKTYVANEAISVLRDAGLSVTACGSSGVAAALVNGTTLHSWANFINGDADFETPLDVVLRKVIAMAANVRMFAATVLEVDDAGTLSAELLTWSDVVLCAVRGRASPFGGVTVLFVRDFLQLAPPRGQYAFLSGVWRAACGDRAVALRTHWRQVRYGNLLGLLLRLRTGTH